MFATIRNRDHRLSKQVCWRYCFLKISFCQRCFCIFPDILKNEQCLFENLDKFQCEKCKYFINFLEDNVFVIKLNCNVRLFGYILTGLQYMRNVSYTNWRLLSTSSSFSLSVFFWEISYRKSCWKCLPIEIIRFYYWRKHRTTDFHCYKEDQCLLACPSHTDIQVACL